MRFSRAPLPISIPLVSATSAEAAAVPAWAQGDEWSFAWEGPRGRGTFTWRVEREDAIDGVPHYVIKTGTREIFYRKDDLALSRETVKRRLYGDGMSYTEFSYLLLQSNDYLQLFRQHGCRLQVGGSDQWGNIVGGVELIRRVDGGSAHALTAPLVTDAEGRKFGKSTGGGNMWLDPEMTSPYSWYQYFVNVSDATTLTYLRMLTFVSQEEIAELTAQTEEKPQLRAAQKRLRRSGFRTVAPAENFYVAGTPGPLLDGECERARRWGESLAATVCRAAGDHGPGSVRR